VQRIVQQFSREADTRVRLTMTQQEPIDPKKEGNKMISTTNVEAKTIVLRDETYVLERIAWVKRLIAEWWPGPKTCLEQYLETKELFKVATNGGCSSACLNEVAEVNLRLARRLGIAVNAVESELVDNDHDLPAEIKKAKISSDQVFTWRRIAARPEREFEGFIHERRARKKTIRASDFLKADQMGAIFCHEDAERLKQYETAFNFHNPERYVLTELDRGELLMEMLYDRADGEGVFDENTSDGSTGGFDASAEGKRCEERLEAWAERKRTQLLAPEAFRRVLATRPNSIN
jgi:hypothetical protein